MVFRQYSRSPISFYIFSQPHYVEFLQNVQNLSSVTIASVSTMTGAAMGSTTAEMALMKRTALRLEGEEVGGQTNISCSPFLGRCFIPVSMTLKVVLC